MRFGNAQELTHRYLNGPLSDQVLVDEVFTANGSQRVSSDVLWQLADQQGTIRDIVDDSGTLRKHVDYDSVGKITGEQSYGAAVDQLFTYDGQELDRSTGLVKMGARWYSPNTGRFVSEDPSGLDPDANPFRFVHNSYPNFTDPTGLSQAGNPLASLSVGNSSASHNYSGALNNLNRQLNPAPSASDYAMWSLTRTGGSSGGFQGSLYAPINVHREIAAWNVAQDPNDSLAGVFRPITQTVKHYPKFLGTELVTAGNRIVDTGSGMGDFVGDHTTNLWYDPSGELSRIENAKMRLERAVTDTAVYAANHPIQSAINVANATGRYVDRVTADPEVSGRLVGDIATNWALTGAGGYAAGFIPEALVGTSRGARVALGTTATPRNVPQTLEALQTRVDTYARRAQLSAFDKGLSGTEAGNYADRYFGKAVSQLDRRLAQAGSEYRAIPQYGRDVSGALLAPYNRPKGSLFLDAVIMDKAETTIFSGWDTRFQSTPYPRWNTGAENAAYVNRFQIQEGFVREISVEASRP